MTDTRPRYRVLVARHEELIGDPISVMLFFTYFCGEVETYTKDDREHCRGILDGETVFDVTSPVIIYDPQSGDMHLFGRL